MAQLGTIAEWNGEQGSGSLVSQGRRMSLYLHDFKELRKQPEVGDVIRFVEGVDRAGRPCVCRAVHANAPRDLRFVHFSILLLLVLPGYAVYRLLGQRALYWAAAWIVLISWFTYQIYATDKRQARNKGEREPESRLHLCELLGGWPGAFFAQRRLRHKSSKADYLFVFMFIIAFHQFMAIDALRGWPFVKVVFKFLDKL